jgi:cell division protein FtsN
MRKLLILLIIASFFQACKSGKNMTPAGYASPPIREQPVARAPEEKPAPPPPAEKPVERPVEKITVVEEKFEFENKAEEVIQQINRYFVILGSFRVNENASKFKTKLEREGYTPVILLSETGFHRLSVNSFSSEAEARQRVLQIRRSFPEYHDAWLLIRR